MALHTIRPDVVKAALAISPIKVTWAWSDQSQGLVQWTFENTGPAQATCVLLRNGYYFGGAFWPVYEANPAFGVAWATALAPLVDNGAASNSPPIGVVRFADGQSQVMFLFTLAPGQSWSMLEGGFSTAEPPVFQAAPLVTLTSSGPMCIGYDEQQVADWDQQTGTNYAGYAPNPSTFTATLLALDPASPDIRLYPGDSATTGACGSPSPNPPPGPTPAPNPCSGILQEAEVAVEAGQWGAALEDVLDWIFCEIENGSLTLKDVLKGVLERARAHRAKPPA
jgi:hypothetical protein